METSTGDLPDKEKLKNRGKARKQRMAEWMEDFSAIIHDKDLLLTTAFRESGNHKPQRVSVKAAKRTAWAIQLFNPKTGKWKYSAFFNIDKSPNDPLIHMTHTVKWCMDRVRAEKDYFTHDTFDKTLCRLYNYISEDIVMVAVLV